MDDCGRCGGRFPEGEMAVLWAGRQYHPRPEDRWERWREDYSARLCGPCADEVWPWLREALRGLSFPGLAPAPEAEHTTVHAHTHLHRRFVPPEDDNPGGPHTFEPHEP